MASEEKQTEQTTTNEVMNDFIIGRNVLSKSYNQFNGRTLTECIDDWQKRWNGFIPQEDIINNNPTSQIFLNFTRNLVVSWLAKVALNPVKYNIKAVSKKLGLPNKKIAEIFKDLVQYSDDNENGAQKFLLEAFEFAVKGTLVVYEGYKKEEQKRKIPLKFDALTGKYTWEKTIQTIFDDCYREIVPIEDFYIANPYEPDVQNQPFVLWRKITTKQEAEKDFGHYPKFKEVIPGTYELIGLDTFYKTKISVELAANQVEIIRYYSRSKNKHCVIINNIVIYDGIFPFKDGLYPFAKEVFEPFDNSFFWGASLVNKIMGEQDLMNTIFSLMIDKTYGSLLPYGLSSDLDDIIEDNVLAPNKIRKVSDINKWKFDTLPGISAGEQAMLQTIMNFAKENSGDIAGSGTAFSPQGGKLPVRQVLLRHQEAMQRLGLSMQYLENFVRSRTILRLNHIIQFYSIPKIEKITGENGEIIKQFIYREVNLPDTELSDGEQGSKIIKLVGEEQTYPEERERLANELSIKESIGEEIGVPTEAIAISVNVFKDYNFAVQVVKNSSYEQNKALEQAVRQEYATWRLNLQQLVPVNAEALVDWVDESFDIDSEQFRAQAQTPITAGGMPVSETTPPQAPVGLGKLPSMMSEI